MILVLNVELKPAFSLSSFRNPHQEALLLELKFHVASYLG